MKKLLTILAASAGLALTASADQLSYTGFESLNLIVGNKLDLSASDDGTSSGDKFWGVNGATPNENPEGQDSEFKAYGDDAKPTNSPDDKTPGDKYLKVETGDTGIDRFINKSTDTGHAAQDLSSNVYFDMDVQFTVSDTVQTPAEGDKLMVWLYGPDNGGTNLVITAAEINESTLLPTQVDYVVPATGAFAIEPDTWHRLTVVATSNIINSVAVPFFEVYVDGTKAEATSKLVTENEVTTVTSLGENASVDKFGSLVAVDTTGTDTTTTTLKSVTFKGTGALDDVVVTTTKPAFIPEGPVETKYFQIGDDTTKRYATFAQALAQAGGDTINLLANYDVATEGGIEFTAGTATLNLGSFNLTDSTTEGEVIATITVKGGALTIIGSGTIEASANELADPILVQNGGTVAFGADGAAVPSLSAGIFVSESYTVKVWGSAEPTAISVYDAYETAFTWDAPETTPGYYTITAGEAPQPQGRTIDGGRGTADVNVTATTVEAAAQKFGTTAASVTDAQVLAYIVGGTVVENEAVVPTPTITVENGTVTVVCSGADENYLVSYYLDSKANLTDQWTAGTTPVAASGEGYTATLTDSTQDAPNKFYRVRAVVSNKLTNN